MLSNKSFELKFEEKKIEENGVKKTSLFFLNNLPSGMGTTIGNFLRRILVSNVSGFSPIAVRVSDKKGFVKSKFSCLEGVKETTPYLIMNLKEIVLSSRNDKFQDDYKTVHSLELKVENESSIEEKIVTARDFSDNENFEIENKDLHIATLSPSSKLESVIYFKNDFGYFKGDDQIKNNPSLSEEENVITLDSNHSPTKLVNYSVNSIVTGLSEEQEQLKLNITTNGSISPSSSLKKALDFSSNLINEVTDLLTKEVNKDFSEDNISENK
jgi:DNA-directed RNA polymerase subunit alpha